MLIVSIIPTLSLTQSFGHLPWFYSIEAFLKSLTKKKEYIKIYLVD